jgi:hypothetical protein
MTRSITPPHNSVECGALATGAEVKESACTRISVVAAFSSRTTASVAPPDGEKYTATRAVVKSSAVATHGRRLSRPTSRVRVVQRCLGIGRFLSEGPCHVAPAPDDSEHRAQDTAAPAPRWEVRWSPGMAAQLEGLGLDRVERPPARASAWSDVGSSIQRQAIRPREAPPPPLLRPGVCTPCVNIPCFDLVPLALLSRVC